MPFIWWSQFLDIISEIHISLNTKQKYSVNKPRREINNDNYSYDSGDQYFLIANLTTYKNLIN
jgi:hypothetical protein